MAKSALFLDTAYIYALFNTRDQWHQKAVKCEGNIAAENLPLVITQFVLTEIANGLSSLKFRPSAVSIIYTLQKSAFVKIIPASSELFTKALKLKDLGANTNFTFDIFIDPTTFELIEKLSVKGINLGKMCFIRQCIKTGNDSLYVIKADSEPSKEWKKSLRGKSIGRYSTHEKDVWLKYGDWLARIW